jgi:hypothetical protein
MKTGGGIGHLARNFTNAWFQEGKKNILSSCKISKLFLLIAFKATASQQQQRRLLAPQL